MFDILHLSCFYVSAISYGHLIQFEDVIKFSSCTGNINLMYSTTNFILAKMQSLETFPTVLSLLKLFLAVLLPRPTVFLDIVRRAVLKLELLVLCHKFNCFRVSYTCLNNILKLNNGKCSFIFILSLYFRLTNLH